MVIFTVALVVIGPDKLPKVARGAGLMMGRVRRFANDIKSDIDAELRSEDLKRLQLELQQQELQLNDELRRGMQPVEEVIRRPDQALIEAVKQASPASQSHETLNVEGVKD
ncbi:twin arginine-targeting protein translocase TatB [Methylophaga lonarensis MPL]|uniref:Twin arginine-targeting protein translocase TatB n=2 Tax=Methylophaga lonarensis TaxID=999151 RepID=M7PU78_9GAMM|nr:twin arginine-targeting protein translocase TatB [Methylophaga lonarensis MPL]